MVITIEDVTSGVEGMPVRDVPADVLAVVEGQRMVCCGHVKVTQYGYVSGRKFHRCTVCRRTDY